MGHDRRERSGKLLIKPSEWAGSAPAPTQPDRSWERHPAREQRARRFKSHDQAEHQHQPCQPTPGQPPQRLTGDSALAWNRPIEIHLGHTDPSIPTFEQTETVPTT